jgi:CRISPR-associated protein Cmr2
MRELAPFFETLPVYRRCDSCGKRAAKVGTPLQSRSGSAVCAINKRDKGRQERRNFWANFPRVVAPKIAGLCQENFAVQKTWKPSLGTGGRIALLYADGNNMGDLLQLMPSPASYRHFSQVLESATRDSLFAAIWTVFGEDRLKDASQPVPFEIIALGGDDVVVIVRAEYGWALALQVLKEFESHPGIQSSSSELSGAIR